MNQERGGPNVVVLTSGGGGNLQRLLDHAQTHRSFTVVQVIVDRECPAQAIAEAAHVPTVQIDPRYLDAYEAIDARADIIVLAGYLSIIPEGVCERYQGRMINTHPSLLPRHGGAGMIGVRVHQSVLDAGDQQTGATVHFVDPGIDSGRVLLQRAIPVGEGETAWQLGGRVFQLEAPLLIEAVELLWRTGVHAPA